MDLYLRGRQVYYILLNIYENLSTENILKRALSNYGYSYMDSAGCRRMRHDPDCFIFTVPEQQKFFHLPGGGRRIVRGKFFYAGSLQRRIDEFIWSHPAGNFTAGKLCQIKMDSLYTAPFSDLLFSCCVFFPEGKMVSDPACNCRPDRGDFLYVEQKRQTYPHRAVIGSFPFMDHL